jgi:hypothetical protein
MNTESFDDIISAALDGERVDVEALRRALATDEGRETLAAFVLLRAATAADDIRPAHPLAVGAELALPCSDDGLAPPVLRTRRRTWLLAGPRVPASLAASLALIAMTASFWFGTVTGFPGRVRSTSPPSLVGPELQLGAQPAPAPATGRAPAPAQQPVPVSTVPPSPGHAEQDFTPAARPRLGRVAEEPPKPTRVLRFEWGVDWRAGF